MNVSNRSKPFEADLARLLAGSLRRALWRARRCPAGQGIQPAIAAEKNGKAYAFELKGSPEGRPDRLIPLLAQAILQARAGAGQAPGAAIPVAVVGAQRIPVSVAEKLKRFASQVAPGMAIGIIDTEGFADFTGHGLEVLNASPSRPRAPRTAAPQRLPGLFSDLNQWMLKVLLARFLPEDLLSAPRQVFRTASQLAQAADVSVMSASRFLRQLAKEGFLDQRNGCFEVVRIQDLLARWTAAVRNPGREFPVRWIVRRDTHQLHVALRSYISKAGASRAKPRVSMKTNRYPRICTGLFTAADALGFGFVHGVPPYIYLEVDDSDVLRDLGLSVEDAGHNPDAYIRIPGNTEALFRAAVDRDGVPVSDILQVWLDVSTHPARGPAQANEIGRRISGPLFGRK